MKTSFLFAILFTTASSIFVSAQISAPQTTAGSKATYTFDDANEFATLFGTYSSKTPFTHAPTGGIQGGCLMTTAHSSAILTKPSQNIVGKAISLSVAWRCDSSLLDPFHSGPGISIGWDKVSKYAHVQTGLIISFSEKGTKIGCHLLISGGGPTNNSKLTAMKSGHWYSTTVTLQNKGGEFGEVALTTQTSDLGESGTDSPKSLPELAFSISSGSKSLSTTKELFPVISGTRSYGLDRVDNLIVAADLTLDGMTPAILVANKQTPPQTSAPQVPTPQVPTPQVPTSQVPTPQAPAPQAPAQPAASQLALDKHWDSPLQGASVTMKELAILFSPFYKPAASISGDTSLKIYEGVTYLMPLKTAIETLGLPNKITSKAKVTCPGFPKDSFNCYLFTGTFDGEFDQLFLVTDLRDKVASVQLVATKPMKTAGSRSSNDQQWHNYNFINNKSKALTTVRAYCDVYYMNPTSTSRPWEKYTARYDAGKNLLSAVLRVDSELVGQQKSTSSLYNKPLEAVRWYVPQPLAELILYCVRKSGV